MNIIVSGFPGVGKSTFYQNYKNSEVFTVLDSDSSRFSKEHFPNNYLDYIEKEYVDVTDKAKIILVSTHEEVRKGLHQRGLAYHLILPHASLKQEYLERYRKRGSNDAFVSLVDSSWLAFTRVLEHEQKHTTVLDAEEYISNWQPWELMEAALGQDLSKSKWNTSLNKD